MSDSNLTEQQRFLFDYVDRNARAIALLGDNIFYFGELGMQEFESAKLMTDLLEKGGFQVERGIAGFPTGFCATYGSGHPVVAIHTEYDSCPDNSQAAGVPSQQFIVEGALVTWNEKLGTIIDLQVDGDGAAAEITFDDGGQKIINTES